MAQCLVLEFLNIKKIMFIIIQVVHILFCYVHSHPDLFIQMYLNEKYT